MPTVTLPIPINGYSDSLNHQHGADGFVTSAMNVVPSDNWEHRRRIGTRQGFQAIADMGVGNDENIQLLLTYEVYRDTQMVQEVLIVSGGNMYYVDGSGDTNAIAYASDTAGEATVTFNGLPVIDETIKLTSDTGTEKTYTVKLEEDLANNQFSYADAEATTTINFVDSTVAEDETITIVSADGTSIVYTAKALENTNANEFDQSDSDVATATSLYNCLVDQDNSPLHYGKITVEDDTAGVLTLTQDVNGTTGNTTVTSTLTGVTTPDFTGGTDTKTAASASLKDCIEHTSGHNGEITVADATGVLTLTQENNGSVGNTAVTSTLTNVVKTNFLGGGSVSAAQQITDYDTVRGIQFGTNVYLVNGKYYLKIDMAASTPVCEEWAEVSDTVPFAGLPEDTTTNDKCTLITRFGGRVVLSGLATSRNNWFMSRIGDADDWSYLANQSAGPQAGDASTDFGLLGEPIVAMFPFGESGLMMASRNTLTYLTADPVVSGAQFIKMSNGVGVMGADAWCQGAEKSCYIAGADGVYMIQPNQFNIQRGQSMTTGRLDGFFSSVNPSEIDLRLAFDPARQTVFMFVNRPNDPTGMVHYQHHIPTQSWWTFTLTDSRMDILKSYCLYQPTTGERAGLWFGMKSGRIAVQSATGVVSTDGDAHSDPLRTLGDNSPDANSTVFTSRLAWSPINAGLPNERLLMTELDVLLDNHDFPAPAGVTVSGPTLSLYGADMAQTLSGLSGDILVTETRSTIDGGTSAATSDLIDGGTAVTLGSIGYSLRGTTSLSVVDTDIDNLDGKTLVLQDLVDGAAGNIVTLQFDKTIGVASTSATKVGIADVNGSALGILRSIKAGIDINQSEGLLLITAEDPDLSSDTVLLRYDGDGEATTTPSGTSISTYISCPEFSGAENNEFIKGGRASSVSGTYTLSDVAATESRRQWNFGGTYTVRRGGTAAGGGDPPQYDNYWGVYEQGATVPEYIASSITDTVPESAMASVEIEPAGFTESTSVVDTQQDNTQKRLLQSWSLLAGRNNRFRVRKRESDFQIQISASGTTWVLEDIAASIEQGGPYRSVIAS